MASPPLIMLAVAASAAWVRSHWVADSAWWNDPNEVRALILSRGKVELYFQQVSFTAPFNVLANKGRHEQAPSDLHTANSGLPTAWERFGFGYAAGTDAYSFRRIILVPCWSIVVIAGVIPAVLLWGRRRMRVSGMRRENRCVACGYDLRATPDRCPECGTAVGSSRHETTPPQ